MTTSGSSTLTTTGTSTQTTTQTTTQTVTPQPYEKMTYLTGYFESGDCAVVKTKTERDMFFASYAKSMVAEMEDENVVVDPEGHAGTCGSIITNSSVRASLLNVADIDRIQAQHPNLNHQQVLEMVIQSAWAKVTGAGRVAATSNVSNVIQTLTAAACRTDCGARTCGHMSDLCGGNVACGSVVCPELQVCSAYGQCEDDVSITLRRIDTHEILEEVGEDPTSSTATTMVFSTTDALHRGLYKFECKVTSGMAEGVTDTSPNDPAYGAADFPDDAGVQAPSFSFEKSVTRHWAQGWAPCTSPHQVAKLPNGKHTFHVRVAEARHVEESTFWEIDVITPDIAFTASPGSIVPQASGIDFAVNATEPVLFFCDLDAGALSNPETLVVDRACFYKYSGCDFKLCNPDTDSLGSSVAFSYPGLAPGRHNVTVRATDEAGNVASMLTWIFTLDDCVGDGGCVPSTPHMAPAKQCGSGYYLDLDDDNLCRQCNTALGCTDGHLHCTNEVDSVCGYCDSGFDKATGENFYDCSHVERWPRKNKD